jgi:hypothetical protein
MKDKIREAYEALEDKVSEQIALELDRNRESIEKAGKDAYELAVAQAKDAISKQVNDKYKPALDALKELIEPEQAEGSTAVAVVSDTKGLE